MTPFKVKILGSVYNSCTNDVFERSWCPLKVDSEGFVDLLDRDNIGLCNPGCSSNSKVIIKVWFWHFWLTFPEFQFLRNPNPWHQLKVLFLTKKQKGKFNLFQIQGVIVGDLFSDFIFSLFQIDLQSFLTPNKIHLYTLNKSLSIFCKI